MTDFARDMERATAEVLAALEAAKVDLVGEGFGLIVDRSPVRTGAYRAEHVVTNPAGTETYYEHPDRPGPNTIVPDVGGVQFEPPSAREVVEAVKGTGLDSVMIQNNRFYAGLLENGSSAQAPQGIYQISADELSTFPVGADDVRIA
jgi:hypothetical protein